MNSDPQTDTFKRSCQHWSEDGRAGMEAFYRLASIDYQLLAEELDWGKVFQELAQRCEPEIRLLDVACGSGQFPAALLKYGGLQTSQNLSVKYSLLDPSEFSIRTARQRLVAPFEPSEEHLCTIQQFEPTASRYAVVWATHALYCVPQCELEVAVDQMLAALEHYGARVYRSRKPAVTLCPISRSLSAKSAVGPRRAVQHGRTDHRSAASES